ncbi:histidine kinase N-terminal 7TM domain-containing protein [Clostridium saccharoperbutylacetonicum]|uniref:histidine kinase N-terminal 7TM domain-containing protein n=1 Tax=Clostridium saccharoperbutylacetonicum TaxID=36745 RepID=UPI0034E0983E
MCLDYTRMSRKYVKVFKVVMIPCLVFFYVTFFTNKFHHIYISKFEFVSNGHFNVLVYEKEIAFYMVITYITICELISTFLYIKGYIKSTKLHEYGYNRYFRIDYSAYSM